MSCCKKKGIEWIYSCSWDIVTQQKYSKEQTAVTQSEYILLKSYNIDIWLIQIQYCISLITLFYWISPHTYQMSFYAILIYSVKNVVTKNNSNSNNKNGWYTVTDGRRQTLKKVSYWQVLMDISSDRRRQTQTDRD